MKRSSLMQNENFIKLHDLLSEFLTQLEQKSLCFLKERNFEKYLVKKLAEYCVITKTKLVSGDERLTMVAYSICFTFIEDIDDKRTGYHPNDVEIGFIIILNGINEMLNCINEMTVVRSISSDYLEDQTYNELRFQEIPSDLKSEIYQMESTFLYAIENFFEKALNEINNYTSER